MLKYTLIDDSQDKTEFEDSRLNFKGIKKFMFKKTSSKDDYYSEYFTSVNEYTSANYEKE